MKFTHLHVHSHYSLLDGLPKIDELLDYAKANGMDSVALSDHGVMYGAVEFYKKAKEKGIKPIIGCEVYLAYEKMTDKRPNIDDKRYHLVLLAKNQTGYKNLIKLTTLAHLQGFYYKPRIDEETLAKYSDGLVGMSSCLQGKIPKLVVVGRYDEAKNLALKYWEIFGKDNFYLEIQHHPNLPEQKKANDGIIQISKETGIPLVAACDSHYLRKDDAEAQDILMLINTGADPNDPERLTMKQDDFSMQPPEKMIEFFQDLPEAIENTQKIAGMCNLELELGKVQLPYYAVPQGKTADEYLKELCLQGLERRFQFNNLTMKQLSNEKHDEILKRLDYELDVISRTGFASYFLIVQDFVNWAKTNGIVVGPGRGSCAGSLVSYLLNITDIDPLKYGLLFERFLNIERIALPDIDLDFTDTRRDEVINYVRQKYGDDHVAQIITFGTMMARQVIRDVGRALGYNYGYCDQLAKMIPFNLTLNECLEKVAEFRQAYDTDNQAKRLVDIAKKLEGVARHASTHACGVVITKEPLDEVVPKQHPTQSDQTIVTQYEMHSIEDLGLLKMDFLGLKNLTIIEEAMNIIEKKDGIEIELDKIPLDDKRTFELLQKTETIGIFQLESEGMRKYLKELKPTELEDIIAMIALYRPGPMELIPDFIARKFGKKPVEYLHPNLESILKRTYGIAVYQEQVLQIVRDIAGFTLGEADVLRKAIGKKIKELLDKQHAKFIEGAIKNGVHKATAERIFQFIEPFANYGFNRSHACCYAFIAYQTAYLKAHFACEFMTALLRSERKDIERIGFLIEECKRMGIKILPPDINESEDDFTMVENNVIRFGLAAVKNVGHNIVEAIIQKRNQGGQFVSIADFLSRIESRDLNKKSLEALIKAGALDKFGERSQLLGSLDKLLDYAREVKKMRVGSQASLFGTEDFVPKLILENTSLASRKDMQNWEKELLGLYVSSHPVDDYQRILAKISKPIAEIANDQYLGKIIKTGGVISRLKKIVTRSGKPMLFVGLEDLTGKIEMVVFPRTIEQNPLVFQENKIVLAQGRVDSKDGVPKLICESVEEIIE